MGMWEPAGDASESAMIKYAQESPLYDAGADGKRGAEAPGIEKARESYPKISVEVGGTSKTWEIKFNSKNKYQVSVHRQPGSDKALLLMKGAPERILNRCSHVYHKGERIELTDELRKQYEDLNIKLASMGRRCLAFCEQELEPEGDKFKADWTGFSTEPVNYPIGESEEVVKAAIAEAEAKGRKCMTFDMAACGKLTYIGMAALIDPPRKQVPPAVDKCKSAGIKVVMVTGDHPATAQAIAREVGIIWGQTEGDMRERNKADPVYEGAETLPMDHPNYDEARDPDFAPAIVVPGWTFDHLTDEATWDDYLRHGQIVFARTSPQQKLIIVENFQKRGQVVAVTGDGVNDAPALKKADIGVAMGIMGSEVSKDAADMILLDDNFSSIVAGVEEGRLIFDNLKKSIAYTLSSNIPEISPFLAFITINIPLPLSTILILCIDLGTDMVPAISMAWENAEADIMKRRPRNAQTDHLVTLRLVCFAYLQIGIVQACAGFYAWMTVLSDYGYVPKILPGLGAFDNWGKQVLYCKLNNGVLRNVDGKAHVTPYNELLSSKVILNKALNDGYFFWDDDITNFDDPSAQMNDFNYGEVVACHFPSKNLLGEESDGNLDWNDIKSGELIDVKNTGGFRVSTTNQILGLRSAGYIPYLPFRGRMSPFFRKDWLKWDVSSYSKTLRSGVYDTVARVNGLGESPLRKSHFQSQPVGYFTVSNNDKLWTSSEYVAYVTAGANDVTKGFQVAGLEASSNRDAFKSGKMFLPGENGFSIFTRDTSNVTEASAPESDYTLVNKLHSWREGNKIYQNVASRQMQAEALAHAQCAGFICIIVVQWADLMICKTRWLSIRQQGMKNDVMNFGLLFETCLGALLCYTPGLGDVLGTRPLRLLHWTPGMPFCLLIFLYDETRKKLMRDSSQTITDKVSGEVFKKAGWLERMTYY